MEKYDTQLPPSCMLYIIYAHTQDNYVWNLFIPAPLGLLENYVSQLKGVPIVSYTFIIMELGPCMVSPDVLISGGAPYGGVPPYETVQHIHLHTVS